MIKKLGSKIMAIPAVAAVASFAAEEAPAWTTATGMPSGPSAFDGVLGYAAPIGIGVVVGVAGVRVVIKLINRGAGK